jgi:malate dehydrogenase
MEVHDCAFTTLKEVNVTTDLNKGFKDIDYAFMIGAKPRGPGMERADLLGDNGKIFVDVGKAMNDSAKRDCKTVVVGNPANTNCLILANHAPDIPKENFTAMTRLDHNRALAQLALKTGCGTEDIKKLAIWGNHSPTMYPDLRNCTIKGKPAMSVVDNDWYVNEFIPNVQQRGKHIIDARGVSSAASAGNASLDHNRDFHINTKGWKSIGVPSEGNPYGVPDGLVFSFPCKVKNGKWKIVKGLDMDDEFTQAKMKATTDELLEERSFVEDLL